MLVFADGGLTATLTRELARDIPISQKSNLVHTFERLYIAVCLLIIVSIYFSAELIANNFLQSKIYSVSQVAHYIRLIGVGVGLQLFSTLYDGGLQGLQQQVLTNCLLIYKKALSAMSIFRSLDVNQNRLVICLDSK